MLTPAEKDAIRHHYQANSASLPGFPPRAPQREMLAAIAQAFARSQERDGDALPAEYTPRGFVYQLPMRGVMRCLIEDIGPDMV